MYPSFLAFSLSGFLLAFILVAIILNGYSDEERVSYQTVMLLAVLSIAFGIHGLGHAYAEIHYGFNPLEGKWCYRLKE